MARDFSPRRIAIALIALTILGGVLRTWNFTAESPWYDEVISLEYLDAPTLSQFIERVAETGTPPAPVYFTLEYFWARYVTDSVVGLRLLSVLLSLLAIPGIYFLARECFDARAGLWAAFFLAVSLSQIYYGQEIRMYAPIPLLAIASLYFLIVGLRRASAASLLANVVCNALLVWTHPFAALLPLVQGLYVLTFARTRLRRVVYWGAAHAALMTAYLIWLRSLDMSRLVDAGAWMTLTRPALPDFIVALLVYAGGRPTNENPIGHLPLPVSSDGPIALVMAGLAAWACYHVLRKAQGLRSDSQSSTARLVGFLAVCTIVPPLLLLVLSWTWRPVFVYRYTLFATVPWVLLAARGMVVLPGGPIRAAIGLMVVALYLYQLTALAVGPFRADWKQAAAFVEEHREPGDRVLCYQGINTHALEYVSGMDQVENVAVWSDVCPLVLDAAGEERASWLFVVLWADPSNFESCFREHNLDFTTTDFESWPKLRVYRISPGED